uniref:Uncharacterized protein n=1 Tax=Glossina pallidipes TaxID=7398 RepID=A0A1B0AA12_GLOPL
MEPNKGQLHNYREFLLHHISNLFQALFAAHEEPNVAVDTVLLCSSVLVLCAFAGGAIYFMHNNQRKSLQALKDKIHKSEETINFLLETIEVIKDVYEKSMRAADYIRIHRDRISAQKLLDSLDHKEATDADENRDKIVDQKPKKIENEIPKRTEDEKQKLAQKISAEIEKEEKILKAMKNEYPKEIERGQKLTAADTLKKVRRSSIWVRKTPSGKRNNRSPSPVRRQRAAPFCRINNQRRVSLSVSEIHA